MSTDQQLHYDFSGLLDASIAQLLAELADCHSALANCHVRIAFLKQEELRAGEKKAGEARLEFEGLRDAYTEKKFLILTLLKHQVEVDGS